MAARASSSSDGGDWLLVSSSSFDMVVDVVENDLRLVRYLQDIHDGDEAGIMEQCIFDVESKNV